MWMGSDSQWDDMPVQTVFLCGLIYVTDHDWHMDRVISIAELVQHGLILKPVHLLRHDGRLHIADGRHRVHGSMLAGHSIIRAKVHDGCSSICPCYRLG